MDRLLSCLQDLLYFAARMQKKMKLSAIRHSLIHGTSKIEGGCQIVQCNIDRHSFCGYDCVILNADIGSFCSIADSVYIGGASHPKHFVSTSPVFLSHRDSVKTKLAYHDYSDMPRTTIGNDVWIGHGAKVRAGIHIGHGAIVGMGAVVTNNVPPYAIVAGNPARQISSRFPESVVKALLEIEWWSFSDGDIKKISHNFTDPVAYLKSIGVVL